MEDKSRIRFGLFENAIDYLASAADLAETDSKRSWKYALLHLVAGIELLLKARLQAEHWALLFADVNAASEKALTEGEFVSIDFRGAIDRVCNITNVELTKKTRERLESLRRYRNRVQHFGIDAQRSQILPLLAYGYHFSFEFIWRHLSDHLDQDTAELLKTMAQKLTAFSEFVQTRLKELEEKLKAAYFLVDCPRCWQPAMELGNGDPRCLFCNFEASADEVAAESDTIEGPELCPECGGPCVSLYDERGEFPTWICFACGQAGDYVRCTQCGELCSGESGGRCSDCWQALLDKD